MNDNHKIIKSMVLFVNLMVRAETKKRQIIYHPIRLMNKKQFQDFTFIIILQVNVDNKLTNNFISRIKF